MKAAREMKIVTGGTQLRVERERGRRRKKGAARSVWYDMEGGRRMGEEERYRLHVGCTEESRASTSSIEQVTLGRSLRAGTRTQH